MKPAPRMPAAVAPLLAALPLALLLAAAAPGARAEKADRDKATEVVADHSTLDDLHQVEVLTGHVVLTKGTMRLAGERMEHHQDERGYNFYVVTAAPGELASFHERRDPVRPGVESTLDGVGERIEYDDRSDQVVLLRRALIKRFEDGEQKDELTGERIVYDGRQSAYDVDGRNPDGSSHPIHITIGPRRDNAATPRPADAGAQPALQPERSLPEGKR